MDRAPLIVANWKMNPRSLKEAKELFAELKKGAKYGAFHVAPPSAFIGEIARMRGKSKVGVAAQDASGETLGAYTGDTSASMLKSLDVSYVIIGHSERRARGESDAEIRKKVAQALKAGLSPILCVGERERDAQGRYFSTVEGQVREALKGMPASKLAQLAIAYEPVWAISTATPNARPATPEDAHEMIIFIRKVLTDLYGRTAASRVRILYGGSVTEKNAAALVLGSGAQGFLVGGASLRPREFSTIVKLSYGN
jgi:triosephosphate isomerase (TIM)